MSRYACKLITSSGTFYAAYDSTIDQFISKALPTLSAVAKELGEDEEEAKGEASRHTFDLRRETIHAFILCLNKLKDGKMLRDAEAKLVSRFEDFFKATAAPHQWEYPSLQEVVDRSTAQLRLQKKRGGLDWWDFIGDRVLWPALHDPERWAKRPSAAQNKLAGRYLSELTVLANIAGPGKSTPAEVVDKFYGKLVGQDAAA